MIRQQALALVTRLVAAYPHPAVGEETIELYVERLTLLDYVACRRAITDLIDADLEHLPRIGRIKRVTSEHVARIRQARESQRLLAAPDPSPEEREAMRARVRKLVEQVVRQRRAPTEPAK